MAKAKKIDGLDCNADALDSAALVLSVRFEEVCNLREAALDWSNIEGVHDMRVATRRLRSALKDFSLFIKKRPFRRVTKELKEIADALGDVRDQDVAILALQAIREEAEQDEVKRGVERYIEEYAPTLDKARICLVKTITVERLARLQEDFTRAIEVAIKTTREDTKEGNQSNGINFLQAGSQIIASDLKEFLKLGDSIYEPFNIEALHDLRIAAKRLRYAIELFDSYCGEDIHSFAHEIAKMQSSLGEVHDCDVWIESLSNRLRRARRGDKDAEQVRQTFIWLLSHYVKARAKHYRAALDHWNELQQSDFAENLLAVCRNKS